MKTKKNENIDEMRRRVLQAALAVCRRVPFPLARVHGADARRVPGILLIGCGASASSPTALTLAAAASLDPTPACEDGDDDPTPAQTEGPYVKTSSPERQSLLESGTGGTRLTVSGLVLTTACVPIARAKLDFWQADDAGAYDNAGFRLRGHQYTDDSGRFTLQTIVPGLYPGRTRHIHVKVQAANSSVLTTQLYFPARRATARTASTRRNCSWQWKTPAAGGWVRSTLC